MLRSRKRLYLLMTKYNKVGYDFCTISFLSSLKRERAEQFQALLPLKKIVFNYIKQINWEEEGGV